MTMFALRLAFVVDQTAFRGALGSVRHQHKETLECGRVRNAIRVAPSRSLPVLLGERVRSPLPTSHGRLPFRFTAFGRPLHREGPITRACLQTRDAAGLRV